MTRLDRRCERLLRSSAAEAGVSLTAATIMRRPWASALFVGNRLTITTQADDDSLLDEWLIRLPEIELALPAHFVASAEVVERRAGAATIELLMVEG
jgi:hypothetical protein